MSVCELPEYRFEYALFCTLQGVCYSKLESLSASDGLKFFQEILRKIHSCSKLFFVFL